MSSEISGILKSLKEICHKIKTEKNYSQYANQLRVNFKGDAYEFYSLKELLDLLSQNVDLPEANKAEVIKLLDELLHDGSNNKDLLIGSFYNFLIQHKVQILINFNQSFIKPLIFRIVQMSFLISYLFASSMSSAKQRIQNMPFS